MNKLLVGIMSLCLFSGVVYAQGFLRPDVTQEQVPGVQPPIGRPNLGMMNQSGRPGASVAASEKFVYVVSNNVLYQYSADSLRLVSQVNLPSNSGRERGVEGDGQRDRNVKPPTVD